MGPQHLFGVVAGTEGDPPARCLADHPAAVPVGDLVIGAAIRTARTGRGWSQERLACQLNHVSGTPTVTRGGVSRWERGTRTPGGYWLPWLAQVLGVPLDELLEARGETAAARTRSRTAARLAKLLPEQAR